MSFGWEDEMWNKVDWSCRYSEIKVWRIVQVVITSLGAKSMRLQEHWPRKKLILIPDNLTSLVN